MRNSAQLLLGFPASAIALAGLVYGCSLVVSYPEIESGAGANNTGGTTAGGGGTGGTGAGGNSGGGPIGGGGGGPQPFTCTWALEANSHEEAVIDNVDATNQWEGHMLSAAWDNDDHLLTVMERHGSSDCGAYQNCAEIRSVNLGAHPPSSSRVIFGADRVFDLALMDDDRAVLLYKPPASDQTLYVKILTPGNLDPAPVELTAPFSPTWNLDRAAIAVVDGAANPPTFDFFAIINVNNQSRIEIFGRHDGVGPVTPSVITDDSVTLGDQDAHIQGLYHHEGRTYAIVGDAQAPLGSRFYSIASATPSKMMYRQIGSTGTFPGAASMGMAGMNITGVIMPPQPGDVFQLLAGRVASADLETFVLTDLPVASQLSDSEVSAFPAGDSAMMRWMGDVAGLFGGTVGDSTQLAYQLYDAYGNERGNDNLEFRGDIPDGMTRDEVASATGDSHDGEMFVNLGGRILVSWMEEQHDNSGDRQVLYYDMLDCSTSPAD